MTVLTVILLALCFILAIIGAFAPVLPSVVFSWLGGLCLFFMPGSSFNGTWLIVFSLVCIAVFCLDYIIPLFTTRIAGGSRAGVTGVSVGLIIACIVPFTPVAFIFGGPWAVFILPFVGAYVGELTVERRNHGAALRSALGSLLGFMFSTGLKIILALSLIWLLFAKVSF